MNVHSSKRYEGGLEVAENVRYETKASKSIVYLETAFIT